MDRLLEMGWLFWGSLFKPWAPPTPCYYQSARCISVFMSVLTPKRGCTCSVYMFCFCLLVVKLWTFYQILEFGQPEDGALNGNPTAMSVARRRPLSIRMRCAPHIYPPGIHFTYVGNCLPIVRRNLMLSTLSTPRVNSGGQGCPCTTSQYDSHVHITSARRKIGVPIITSVWK